MRTLFCCLFGSLSLLPAAWPDDPLLFPDDARRLPFAAQPERWFRSEYQWMLRNPGQSSHVYDAAGVWQPQFEDAPGAASIDAERGWTLLHDAPHVLVALVDSGVFPHPDLVDNLEPSPLSFTSPDTGDPTGHGTAMAGVIAATGNNGRGTAGVIWHGRVLSLKWDFRSAVVPAMFDTALERGAGVVCYAWGSSRDDPAIRAAIIRLATANIVLVCAAPNAAVDLDGTADYPAGWQLDNVIVVTSSTRADTLYPVAAWGRHTVHLAAPGRLVPVLATDGGYRYDSGTSYACALVTGAVALLRERYPQDSARRIKQRLLAGVDRRPAFANTVSGGRLNLFRALSGGKPDPVVPVWNP